MRALRSAVMVAASFSRPAGFVDDATLRRACPAPAVHFGRRINNGYRAGVDPAEHLVVTATARDGAGIARSADGRVMFVEDALPGETVTAEVLRVEKRWSRARAVKVLTPSPQRVPVSCRHRVDGCGGCDLLHVAGDHQLDLKAGIVTDQLERAGVEFPQPDLVSLTDDQGRTTVRAAVVTGRAGYRARSSHDVIVPASCPAVDPLVEELLVDGRFGDAAEVTIRAGSRTGDRLVLVDGDPDDVDVPDDVLVVGADELAAGRRAWIHEEAAGRSWRISARSFFQNRPTGVDALVALVAEAIDALDRSGGAGPLVDAYAGVGIFAGTVGARRPPVAVERSADSLADARVNLAGGDVRIVAADVAAWPATPAAVVVADPARAGLGRAGVDALLAADPGLFVLVGCDPGAFARDAGLLAAAGWRLERLAVVDLFPDTSHVETVGVFTAR